MLEQRVALDVFVVLFSLCANGHADAQEGNAKSISLSSIVTTSPQKGMLRSQDEFPLTGGDHDSAVANGYLRQILTASKGGASNAFLVDAVNAHSAIAASSSVLVGSRSAAQAVPVNTPNPPRGNHWLVVYLGSGPSSPTWWMIESVTVDEGKIVLSYRKPKPRPATDDIYHYYYWIPLRKLGPGDYEVQLFDADKQTVSLMRRVEVTSTRGTGGAK